MDDKLDKIVELIEKRFVVAKTNEVWRAKFKGRYLTTYLGKTTWQSRNAVRAAFRNQMKYIIADVLYPHAKINPDRIIDELNLVHEKLEKEGIVEFVQLKE